MSRRFLIAANWKMNPMPENATSSSAYQSHSAADVWVFPQYLDLAACVQGQLFTGAQCGRHQEDGAYTGDVSMKMIAAAGCRTVLCGHSERRQYHGETNEMVAEQAIAALEHNLHPVICIGETDDERTAGREQEVVAAQLAALPTESDITIAYEPVWAIGTGKTATPEQAQEMHAFIRSQLPADTAGKIRILYGGSMKPLNAKALLEQPDIDGGLIGGASLVPEQFSEIVQIAVALAE